MAEKASADDLGEVLGEIREQVTIKGRVRVITPLRTRQFVDVLKAVDRLIEAGVIEVTPAAGVEEAVAQARREFSSRKMVLRGGDQLIRIVSAGSGLSVSEVEGLELGDMLRLTAAVFKVNLDFFDQNAAEMAAALGPLWETVKGLLAGETPGQPPSPVSSEPATD